MDPLVLLLVVLEGEALAGLDDEDLPDVAVGVGPDELVAPGLVHPARELVGRRRRDGSATRETPAHPPLTSCSPDAMIASRTSGEVASV